MTEQLHAESTPGPAGPAAPVLPVLADDGIGLGLDEARALLSLRHNLSVSPDDPILVTLTLNNAFLTEMDKLLARHRQALGAMMGAETERYAGVLGGFQESLSRVTSEGVSKAALETLERLTGVKRDLCWLAALIGLSALINAVVLWVGR